ncbi:MAG: universal stress protein [Phycisphaerae bacterium]|nr:universal stress protein [Tepidisphaeraceae bacterium]
MTNHDRSADGNRTERIIVVAVEASEPSRWAVDVAGRLAGEIGGHVVLLHVVVPPTVGAEENLHAAAELMDDRRRDAVRLLGEMGGHIPAGLRCEQVVREGLPAREIVAYAAEAGADLVVVGSRGRGRLGRFLIGSTAEDVLRGAPCPVLTVAHGPATSDARPAGAPTFAKVLVAVDADGPGARGVVVAAARVAAARGTEIGLVHVIPSAGNFRGELGMPVDESVRIRQGRGLRLLNQVGRELDARPRYFVRDGEAAAEIVAAAAQWGADLIVVGASARGRLAELFLGSTAEEVIRHAPCPVMAVRHGVVAVAGLEEADTSENWVG